MQPQTVGNGNEDLPCDIDSSLKRGYGTTAGRRTALSGSRTSRLFVPDAKGQLQIKSAICWTRSTVKGMKNDEDKGTSDKLCGTSAWRLASDWRLASN